MLFWNMLPKAWVFREVAKDYGIDVEVEVFDENGNATGLVFLAQIKGTSKSSASGRRARLKIDRIRHYNSLELPVLVVRSSENEGEVYVRWSRSIDLFYAKDGAKTYGVTFGEEHRWDGSKPQAIIRELRDMRRIRNPGFSLPLSFSISASCRSICGIATTRISSEIRRIAGYSPGLFILKSEEDHPLGHVSIGGREVASTLGQILGCVVHSIDKLSPDEIRQELPQYILLGFGIALYRYGHHGAASAIIRALDPTPMMRRYPVLAQNIWGSLLLGDHLEYALELWDNLGKGPNALTTEVV
ncbi:DUF4365 domain-containing protein [bacterium]|nr:DUF4365 domain-containing protein [bacterium]